MPCYRLFSSVSVTKYYLMCYHTSYDDTQNVENRDTAQNNTKINYITVAIHSIL